MGVAADRNFVAVDLGIMGGRDWDTRRYLADMLIATLEGDYHRLAAVYMEAGYLPQSHPHGHALDVFAQALRSVCEPLAGRPLNEISFARPLAQLLRHSTEARRVGTGCVSTCRSRWSPFHSQKKKT